MSHFCRCIAQTGPAKGPWRGPRRDLVHPLVQAVRPGEQLHQAAGQALPWSRASSSTTGQAGCSPAAITAAAAHPAPRESILEWASQGPHPSHGRRLQEGRATSPSTAASSSCPSAPARGNNRKEGEKGTRERTMKEGTTLFATL